MSVVLFVLGLLATVHGFDMERIAANSMHQIYAVLWIIVGAVLISSGAIASTILYAAKKYSREY
jgi:hypothetical protein